MKSYALMKRWGVAGACLTASVMLAACSRQPQDVSVSTFNYTDRALAYVLINGADAGYTLEGEGGGSACCSVWPDTSEVLVEWQYDRPTGTPEKASDFVKKKVKLPLLPTCWQRGMTVTLVAHVYPGNQVQLETLLNAAPGWLSHARRVPLKPDECQVSIVGPRQ